MKQIDDYIKKFAEESRSDAHEVILECLEYCDVRGVKDLTMEQIKEFERSREKMETGLFDKNETPIKVGDKVRLALDNGEVREFDVCFKKVRRTVKCHPDFDDRYADVYISGIVFCWNGYDLFPCIDVDGICDTEKMEVIK